MTRHYTLFLLILTIMTISCKKKVVVTPVSSWEEIPNLSLNSTVNRILPSGNELLIATVDNLVRLDANESIIERRELDVEKGIFGKPILSDHILARVLKNYDNERELQLHLTKSINQIYRITEKEIADSAEFVIFEELDNATATGAFNDDGSQFLYVARSLAPQANRYTFFLFDIQLNSSKSQFQSVTLSSRVDVPPTLMGSEADLLTNVRFINGNFYVTSLGGAFRIQPDGAWNQFFTHWVWDIFERNGDLFTTGFYENQFYKSEDDGVNWAFANIETPLKKVTVTGDKIFAQDNLGLPFKLSDEDFVSVQDISYNSNFFEDWPTAYQAIQFFNGKYYLSVHKRLFATEEIVLE